MRHHHTLRAFLVLLPQHSKDLDRRFESKSISTLPAVEAANTDTRPVLRADIPIPKDLLRHAQALLVQSLSPALALDSTPILADLATRDLVRAQLRLGLLPLRDNDNLLRRLLLDVSFYDIALDVIGLDVRDVLGEGALRRRIRRGYVVLGGLGDRLGHPVVEGQRRLLAGGAGTPA